MQAFYAWLRRHPVLVDSVLALFVAGLGLGVLGLRYLPHPVAVIFMVAMVAPVALRRKYPAGAFAAVVVAGGVEVLVLRQPVGSDLSVVILLYTLAAYRPRRLSVPGLGVCLLGSAFAVARWAPAHATGSLFTLLEVFAVFGGPAVTAWLLGDLMQWRRGYYRALEERAARLEAERGAQAQIAAAAERARIARELHDIVAHNVSVMVVQADGAGYALDTAPERAREALDVIARTGRQALAEMRSLLGVLRTAGPEAHPDPLTATGPDSRPARGPGSRRASGPRSRPAAGLRWGGSLHSRPAPGQPDGPGPGAGASQADAVELAPQPGIEQVTGLLEQARAAGLPVSFAVEGVPRPLAAGPALAAYRIVQESLTNTRKHGGPAATAAVTLRFRDDELVIRVTDDGRGARAAGHGGSRHGDGGRDSGAAGPGHGLLGMRERVETYGGTVLAGPLPGGGWRIRATLPLSGPDRVLGAAR